MAAMKISEIIYSVTDLTSSEVSASAISDTFVPMAVSKILTLVPDFEYTVTSDTTGDILMDKAIAELSSHYVLQGKGLTPYNPVTGEPIMEHFDVAMDILMDKYGVEVDGRMVFPSQVRNIKAYVGGVRMRCER